MNPVRQLVVVVILGGLLASGGSVRAEASPAAKPFEVQEYAGIAYYKGKDADKVYHQLDLYLPKGKKDFPVILFVHGGYWMIGDKSFFGWGQDLGRFYAGQGIGVVMPSYRLAPAVKYGEQVKDVARAFAWMYHNIGSYGGSTDQLFVLGHSAGGHLVSLLALEPEYLKAEHLSPSLIKGEISVSGVYWIPAINFRMNMANQASGVALPGVGSLGFQFNPFAAVFGNDPKALKEASPMSHVHAGLPPFLVIYADNDLPTLGEMAREFAGALQEAHDPVRLMKIEHREHESVMFDATTLKDPVAQAILQFVQENLPKPGTASRKNS